MIDEYTVLKVVGKGSYGVARLVEHKVTGDQIVMKEINTQSMTEEDRSRCLKELVILREVSHPNIVSHIASVESEKLLVIFMEYCDGGDLGEKIKGGVPMPSHDVIMYAVQLVMALHYLHHTKKVLHRDLKPSNVFLTSRGHVKLGDFGVSTILHKTAGYANTFCGTPYYLSPELCQDKPYNSRSDMWALGCILYEMCAGKRPFVRKNIVELADCITRAEYSPLPMSVDPGLREMISGLLQRVPEVRPSAYRLLRSPFVQFHLARLSRRELDYPAARDAVVMVAPPVKVASEAGAFSRHDDVQTMQRYVEESRESVMSDEIAGFGFVAGSFDMSQELRGGSYTTSLRDSGLDAVLVDDDTQWRRESSTSK